MITEEIKEWISKLPRWQQKLSNLIIEKKTITEEVLNEIYGVFKVEMKLEEGTVQEDSVHSSIIDLGTVPNIVWQGVSNLHGVNKLKSNVELNVSEGLTVIYGENGSGKSGYTRLLNNAFISRGDQEILPNIYADKSEAVSAEFKFCIDGDIVEYTYPDNKDEYPFSTIRNFDSKSAADDMNKESKIDFAPSELSFFDLLLSACLEIQKKLDDERAEKKINNPTLQYFPNKGKALSQMEMLSANTKVEDIKEKFQVTKEEKDEYEKIKVEKANLVSLDINKQSYVIDQVIVFLNKAKKRYEVFEEIVSDGKIDIYNQQIYMLKKSRLLLDRAGIALFKNDDIEYVGTKEWKEFIKAAKRYFDEISTHDKCPLCGNKISEKDLIFKYWEYLESDAENNYKVAKDAVCTSIRKMEELDLSFLVKSSIQEEWLLDNFKEEAECITMIFNAADITRKQILDSLENEKEVIEKCVITKPDIEALIVRINEKKNNLNQDKINKRIEECSKFESEYVDKTKVIDLLPVISSYINYLKWDALAEKSKIKTRMITNKQKELFGKYVTDDYLKTFEEECRNLNADFNVGIISRGSNGQTLKKLQIKGTAPGKVLSEGEQRAISIANFLTEVKMDARNIGIVFDDPVCSLDHKRRSVIVKRLLEEAKNRQVVIFTHEITFFMELKTEADRIGVKFEQATIREIGNEPGDISRIIPWQGMKVKERIGKLYPELFMLIQV